MKNKNKRFNFWEEKKTKLKQPPKVCQSSVLLLETEIKINKKKKKIHAKYVNCAKNNNNNNTNKI